MYQDKFAEETSIIFLNPVFSHTIWGGTRLRTEYGYTEPGDDIGECWGIAANRSGDCTIASGAYEGMHLSELYKSRPELFGNIQTDRFPLLVKIIDAKADLSIQVHPDDSYAMEHEHGSLGKMECWYILDCEENATLVIGHNASTREELESMIAEGRWTEFIREVPIKKGDFIQINPGTVHAIKGNTVIIETQQNSDITYRVYDYDRLSNGALRELHIKQSMDVITVPAASVEDSIIDTNEEPVNQMNELISCEYYKVFKLDVAGIMEFNTAMPFLNVSVVAGDGTINGQAIHKGTHFILPYGYGSVRLQGNMQIIASTVAED